MLLRKYEVSSVKMRQDKHEEEQMGEKVRAEMQQPEDRPTCNGEKLQLFM